MNNTDLENRIKALDEKLELQIAQSNCEHCKINIRISRNGYITGDICCADCGKNLGFYGSFSTQYPRIVKKIYRLFVK